MFCREIIPSSLGDGFRITQKKRNLWICFPPVSLVCLTPFHYCRVRGLGASLSLPRLCGLTSVPGFRESVGMRVSAPPESPPVHVTAREAPPGHRLTPSRQRVTPATKGESSSLSVELNREPNPPRLLRQQQMQAVRHSGSRKVLEGSGRDLAANVKC